MANRTRSNSNQPQLRYTWKHEKNLEEPIKMNLWGEVHRQP